VLPRGLLNLRCFRTEILLTLVKSLSLSLGLFAFSGAFQILSRRKRLSLLRNFQPAMIPKPEHIFLSNLYTYCTMSEFSTFRHSDSNKILESKTFALSHRAKVTLDPPFALALYIILNKARAFSSRTSRKALCYQAKVLLSTLLGSKIEFSSKKNTFSQGIAEVPRILLQPLWRREP